MRAPVRVRMSKKKKKKDILRNLVKLFRLLGLISRVLIMSVSPLESLPLNIIVNAQHCVVCG